MTPVLLLVPLAPAVALPWLALTAPHLLLGALPVYLLTPLLAWRLGTGLAASRLGQQLAERIPARIRENPLGLRLAAVLLPYLAYFVGSGLLRWPLAQAYRAFLSGPGVGVLCCVVAALVLGRLLPTYPAVIAAFLLNELLQLWRKRSLAYSESSQA